MGKLNIIPLLLGMGLPLVVSAGEVQVAVAANFAKPLQEIGTQFKVETGHELKVSSGATGKLYAQIEHGAPFEVFLSADATTPGKLVEVDLAEADSRFVYAFGKLALWSSDPATVDAEGAVLQADTFKHLAIANPRTAPYGAAALQVLEKLKLLETLKPKLVQGENITQAYDFVASGNAELGFVALSQVQQVGKPVSGSLWLVPAEWYAPLAQEAVLLAKGKGNPAAHALLDYLKTPAAQAVMLRYSYGLPDADTPAAVTKP